MTPLDSCRQALADIAAELAATLPSDRARALFALLRAGEAGDTGAFVGDPMPNVHPGWNLALHLCLDRPEGTGGDMTGSQAEQTSLAIWAERFLSGCDQVALTTLALARCASGQLQLQQRAPRTFVAWPASRQLSPDQRERADFDWWSAYQARQAAPRLASLLGDRDRMRALLRQVNQGGAPLLAPAGYATGDPTIDGYYRQLGQAYVARFACQHSYPDGATIGGATFGLYSEIVALLIGWLYQERDRRATADADTPVPWDERALIAALAAALDADPVVIEHAPQLFLLDRANAAYHSALAGSAAPPLIRLDARRVVRSTQGLLGEPLLFLTRELRRRHGQEYHNSAHLREDVFRQDLYHLFDDRRFIRSARPVVLRRDGAPRTDLDALVFDRKTGTLGVFELKAQDPFARSLEERQRQRDNFLQANRQVSATLEWVQRHGPDDLLARFDAQAARRVHTRKVHVFVLGRYLARVSEHGSPTPDRRAAWGSWPRVLQIVESGAVAPDQRNPLGTLFARLRDAIPPSAPDQRAGIGAGSQEIAIRDLRLRIFPSFAAMRAIEEHPG